MTIPEAVQAMPERIFLGCADADNEHQVWTDEGEGGTEFVRADLAAPFLQGVKVKALEWGEVTVGKHNSWVHPLGLQYFVYVEEGNWTSQGLVGKSTVFHGYAFATLEAAKAAAQADYEARILSAIEVSGNPGQLEPSPAPAKRDYIDCACTKIQQDEHCIVGYPSLLCEICDGKGVVPSPRAQALEEAAKIAFDVSENGHYYGEASVDSTSSIYQQGAFEVYEALRALSSQPVAATEIIGEGATVWLRVDENKDGSQEITVTDTQGFSEVPDGEYLFIRHGSSQPVADGCSPKTLNGYVTERDAEVIKGGAQWAVLVHCKQSDIYSAPVTVTLPASPEVAG